MATTQYIGARYVPLFSNPIEWDNTREYEPLTIVMKDGASYTSKQYVPKGIELTNESFWAITGNYNAQVEQYRKEVTTYDARITTAQETADSAKSDVKSAGESIELLNNKFPVATENVADGAVTTAKIAANAVATNNVADGAVTTAKIAGGAVTTAKIAANAVATENVADVAVTTAKIAGGAVTAAKIAANAVATNNVADGAVTTAKIAANAVATNNVADGAVTAAKIAANAVATTKLQDGSITAPKIAKDAANNILNGFTIRHFKANDSNADNEGLVFPTDVNSNLEGFFIKEISLLVITEFQMHVATGWSQNSTIVKLPSYVPTPDANYEPRLAQMCIWDDNNSFKTWCGIRITKDGYIQPRGLTLSNANATSFSPIIILTSIFSTGITVTQNIFDAYKEESGLI